MTKSKKSESSPTKPKPTAKPPTTSSNVVVLRYTLFLASMVTAGVAYYIQNYSPPSTAYFPMSSNRTLQDQYAAIHRPLDLSPHVFENNDCGIPVTASSSKLRIQEIMEAQQTNPLILAQESKVFVMGNGENEGYYMAWTEEHRAKNCLASLAEAGAKQLGASALDLRLGKMLYNNMGEPIRSVDDIEKAGRIVHILYDQEVWMWPGIEVGYKWTVDNIEMETLDMDPRVILVKDIITDEECQMLIDAGKDKMQHSPSIAKDSSKFPDYRTSNTAFISEAPISKIVGDRGQRVARLPFRGYVEAIQLVKYEVGQWFKQHTDYFDHFDLSAKLLKQRKDGEGDLFESWTSWAQQKIGAICGNTECPSEILDGGLLFPALDAEFQNALIKLFLDDPDNPGWAQLNDEWKAWLKTNSEKGASDVLKVFLDNFPTFFPVYRELWEKIAGPEFQYQASSKFIEPNRHVTLFLYLNNVEEGGETVFPRSSKASSGIHREGMPECSRGLAVKPVKRAGALFYCKKGNGENDPQSYHGACPPVKGVKWGSNVFMWNSDARTGVKLWGF